MYLTLTDLILLTSIIQALSLATFLLLPPNNRLVSNQLLVATLVFFAAGLGEIFSTAADWRLHTPIWRTSAPLSGYCRRARSFYTPGL